VVLVPLLEIEQPMMGPAGCAEFAVKGPDIALDDGWSVDGYDAHLITPLRYEIERSSVRVGIYLSCSLSR